MNQILRYWPILTVVFASGVAHAWQEAQRQHLERVVIQQSATVEKVADLQQNIAEIKAHQQSTKDLLNRLLDLQLKKRENAEE